MSEEVPAPTPAQQHQTRYVELVISNLRNRLGERDVECAQLQARAEMIAEERDYFLRALRDNGLIQDPTPEPPVEVEEAEEAEELPPPGV